MLQGEKVLLRAIEREDLRPLWQMRNDLEVESRVNDAMPRPQSLADVEARFDKRVAEPDETVARFAIVAADEVIGRLDLWGIDSFHGIASIGLSIRQQSWSRGYGQEAIRLIVDYAFTYLNLRKICIQYLGSDERAGACYRKAGFVEEGRLKAHNFYRGEYIDMVHMAVFRDA